GHAGRKASANLPWEGDDHIPANDERGWETIAPSAVAQGGGLPRVPRAMTLADIERVRGDFVAAAERARDIDIQWLKLHFAHGYLAQSFLSRHANRREDAYGGSFENRSRFLIETLAAVRKVWPANRPLSARLGVIEYDGRDEETLAEAIELVTLEKSVTELRGEIETSECGAAIVDMDVASLEQIESLQRVVRRLEGRAPVVVVTQEFNAAVVRILVQLQVADFLVKPITTADLVRSCIRALQGPGRQDNAESQVYTFMPAAGGVGTTTLAVQTAFQLHRSVTRAASTCVVDLNFQQGACAEYLDLEPRFDINEIENQPERLDRQLLDVMLSRHESGLCVLAAPTDPADMRSFNTDVVVRMLDLVSAYFDNVVIDMPRTWFPWTETVLLGSNRLYIVSEMTVPCLRHTQRLIKAIEDRTAREVKPAVIVNRFE
ncbi:hypothetical protein J0H33_07460, partial [bacterium]|nr:hypothetical protein [bacterium]